MCLDIINCLIEVVVKLRKAYICTARAVVGHEEDALDVLERKWCHKQDLTERVPDTVVEFLMSEASDHVALICNRVKAANAV